MSLFEKIDSALKEAMRSKDAVRLRGIREIKAQLLLAKTDGSGLEMTEEREVKILQKMLKQRQESAEIYAQQNRPELKAKEDEEILVIKEFLPTMLEGEALEAVIREVIAAVGATTAKDMGKVMAEANKRLSGKAEGRVISETVKRLLS
jgi:uncharacterized protein YqeY